MSSHLLKQFNDIEFIKIMKIKNLEFKFTKY
jgi:hypothetical protein